MKSPRLLFSLALLIGLASSIAPSPAAGAPAEVAPVPEAFVPGVPPERIWVAWLDGRTLSDAIATGARILDRFPDAVIVADAGSEAALRFASFRVDPGVALPAGSTVTLYRRGRRAEARSLDSAALAADGVTLLWQGGANAIVASEGPPEHLEALHGWRHQSLRQTPIRRFVAEASAQPLPDLHATDFAPMVQDMVDAVSATAILTDIGRLSGRGSVLVGGSPVTFNTRHTPNAKCDQAEQYVFERFQALGFTDVAYDPFSFSGTNARNVVATLPGVETPGHVVILGAHLDSTSPIASTSAPGANDNASGVAGLLAAAEILRQHSFRSTIRFIAFTGEEQGLYGSTHYANAAAAGPDTVDAAVIYDMIGWYDNLNQIDIEGETEWLPVMNVMDDACAEYTGLDTQIQLFSFGSDHVPFQNVNIPSFLAIESEYGDYPCYHQACDTTGWNDSVFVADVVRAGIATVAHLAGPRGFYISHTRLPATENTAGPYEVVATIQQLATLVPDSLRLHWSAGGPFTSVNMTATGNPNEFHANIPGIPGGTIQYWLSAADVESRSAVHPPEAPDSLHRFIVAPRETILVEGFEAGAPGWTHGGLFDDWQYATPAGLTEDPTGAHSGTKAAGNDLTGLGSVLGRYENNRNLWLESPTFNCADYSGVRLDFWRDLAIERSNGGLWDYARLEVNNILVWESPSAANLNDAGWTAQSFDISALADGNPSVRLRFSLHSDAGTTFGGWTLDDITVTGLAPPPTVSAPVPGAARAALRLESAPNPGRFGTTVRFELPRRERAHVAIYDVRGALVRTLADGVREGGRHELAWDGRGEAGAASGAGVYFCRLTAGGKTLARKLVLLQ